MVLAHFQNQIQGLSRAIRGIFKKTTLNQNGTFISISKQVQSNSTF